MPKESVLICIRQSVGKGDHSLEFICSERRADKMMRVSNAQSNLLINFAGKQEVLIERGRRTKRRVERRQKSERHLHTTRVCSTLYCERVRPLKVKLKNNETRSGRLDRIKRRLSFELDVGRVRPTKTKGKREREDALYAPN
jgi:hypothetical protein